MSEKLSFYERVNNLQDELIAPKSNYNSFGKYKYRSAEDILEAVKPLNKKHGVILFLSDEPLLIGDWHYIKATAKLIDTEDNNNQIEVTAYARESLNKKGMDDSQITGTASSYARKYALNGLYLIDDTKDADTDEYRNQNDNKTTGGQPQLASDKQLNLVDSLLKKKVNDDYPTKESVFDFIVEYYGLPKDMTTWTKKQASHVIEKLQDKKESA